MSYTTIYSIDKDGDVIEHTDIKNAHKIYILVWEIIYDLYNDYLNDNIIRPDWMPEDYTMNFSDLQISGNMESFWLLFHDKNLLTQHRIEKTFLVKKLLLFCYDSKSQRIG